MNTQGIVNIPFCSKFDLISRTVRIRRRTHSEYKLPEDQEPSARGPPTVQDDLNLNFITEEDAEFGEL